MRITKIELTTVKIPIVRTHKIATYTLNAGIHVLVAIHTDNGLVGLGEAPLSMGPVFPEETWETAISVIRNPLATALLGKDPFDIEAINVEMKKLAKGNFTAKASLDFAVHDLMSKAVKLPLYDLIGGAYRDRIPMSWSFGIGDAKLEVEEALERVKQGFRIFKIKVAFVSEREDIERVRLIREAVGDEIDLRLDCNQGWRPDKAIKLIKKMERYELGFVEQPVPSWDIRGLARIAKAVDTPIMADESLFTPSDALTIIENDAADIFAIKLMKHGGILDSKKIVALAEAADIPCYIGSNLETGVATAICAHFGAATSNVTYGCELFGPFLLRDDIIRTPIKYQDGTISAPAQGPGLGVELDPEKVSNYAIHAPIVITEKSR